MMDIEILPCSGSFALDSAGNSVITVSAKYYEELHKKAEIDYTPRKIYGEEDKMKLVDDKSFWRQWWK